MAEKLKSFYFRHDENAANDIKHLALRSQLAMEGYGIYWFLVEQLALAGGRMQLKMIPMLAAIMQTTPDKAMSVVKNYDLFTIDEDGFFSERLNKELEKRGTLSEVGRAAGLKSAESRRLKALPPTDVERTLNGSETTVQPVEKRREEDSIEKDRREQSLVANATGESTPSDLDLRKEEFKKQVFAIGGTKYTKQMLDDFFTYWTEANRAKKPKMRFETEKAFELPRRFTTWEKKTREYRCLLTDSERSIKQKQFEFRNSLIPFKGKYSPNVLNAFYAYWIQPELKTDGTEPEFIRWERESFWDTAQRLSQWHTRNEKKS